MTSLSTLKKKISYQSTNIYTSFSIESSNNLEIARKDIINMKDKIYEYDVSKTIIKSHI